MRNKKQIGIIRKKIFTNILLFAMFLNIFSFEIFAQKNELFLKHDTTDYLNFGEFKLENMPTIDNSKGAYSYSDGGSGTGDLSLKYNNTFNVKLGRQLTSSGYVLILSGWTYDNGGLGWIQLSSGTKANNTQDPVNQNTFLSNSENQNNNNYGVWIDSNSIFHGKGMVDSDSSFVTFTGSSAINPKPFDIDGDGLSNSEEAQIFLSQNNVGDIDGDGFTDGELDWDSDGDGLNDKDDPFPTNPDEPGDGYVVPVDTSCDSGIDSDNDGIDNNIECIFGLNSNDSTDANKDFDSDGLSNKIEILGQNLNINYKDKDGNNLTHTGLVLTDPWNADTDNDGSNDLNEFQNGTHPNNPDTDGDGIPDGTDLCPLDGENDCDTSGKDWSDDDDDGLPKWWEDKYTNGKNSDRNNPQDSDNTVIRNNSEDNGDIFVPAGGIEFGLNSGSGDTSDDGIFDTYEDFDNDGFSNIDEYKNGTNPNNWDSDGDHLSDFEDPDKNNALDLNGDEDGDSLLNGEEIDGRGFNLKYKNNACTEIDINIDSNDNKTKYNNKDSDLDGLSDNEEKQQGTNPLIMDTDGDGFSDFFEISLGFLALNGCITDNSSVKAVPIDSDGDGLLDSFEKKYTNCNSGSGYSLTGSIVLGFSGVLIENCSDSLYKLDFEDINSNEDPDTNGKYDNQEDFDNDGWSNEKEQLEGTNPFHWDTDGDGIPDNMDPNPNDSINILQDTDGDGISDKIEILGINISYSYKKDVNGTCTDFSFNKKIFSNYEKFDSDFDGLSDKYEIQNLLNPIEKDIDGDGFLDGEEIKLGTNPKNGCSGDENIPSDNDNDGLVKIFEDRYTNGINQENKIFILEKITTGGNTIYKSSPELGDDGNKEDYNLIDNINGENPDSDNDIIFDGNEDFDNDGFSNKQEQINGTNPNNWDTDFDGIPDNIDTNPTDSGSIITVTGNITNSNIDSDIYGPDSDGDGLSDFYENKIGTNPNNPDSDGDGIPDGIEDAAKRLGDLNGDPNDNTKIPTDTDGDFLPDVFENLYNNFDINNNDGDLGEKFGGNGKFDGFEDNDNDGIINIFELIYGTDPNNNDTDGDGVLDGIEITASKLGDLNGNPIDSQKKPIDTDFDGIPDIYEEEYPNVFTVGIKDDLNKDTDGDGLSDLDELKKGTNPENSDTDGDGIPDLIDIFPIDSNNGGFSTITELEDLLKNIDTDFDGISDYDELNNIPATDPYNPDSDGDGVIDGIELVLSKAPFLDPNSDPLDPTKTPADTDGDILPDVFENYNFTTGDIFQANFDLGNYFKMNFNNSNTYSQDFIDAFADADYDGVSNLNELLNGTNPYDETSFIEGGLKVPNENLVNYILPTNGDFDGDGISNLEEFNLGTDPRNKDSDGDGIEDGVEIAMKKFWGDENGDPLNGDKTPADTDLDGIPDIIESYYSAPKYNPGFDNSTDNGGDLDYDSDGLSNILEIVKNTNPFDWDTDNDGIPDGIDSNPNSGNLQGDYNLYLDSDSDGLSDKYEISMKENFGGYGFFDEFDANLPANGWDSDGDGLADLFEDFNHENLSNFTVLNKDDKNTYDSSTSPVGNGELLDKYFDTDGDTLSNLDELLLGTNPYSTDTDGDGIPDNLDLNPIVFGNGVDTDGDGIPDFTEIHGFTGTVLILDNGTEFSKTDLKFFTNSLKFDSDLDGLSDGYEIYHQLNPLLKDTDNDGWEDGIELNVSYIDSTKGNPNDKSIFPTDSDGDGLADEWENYYTDPDDLTKFKENGDFDGDGFSDLKEMQIGSDPTINNFTLQIEINELISTSTCDSDWSNTGKVISVISPLNLNNLDKNNSGFFTYINQAKTYDGNTSASPNSIFMPLDAGKWINNNQNESSLNGSLVSIGSFAQNANAIGPNKFEITIKADSYEPYVGFKIIDFISGKVPDPLMTQSEMDGFLINQKNNEKDIYLGKSCVDATPPVCGVTLSGGNHEQNHGLKDIDGFTIPLTWTETNGWTNSDGTQTGKNLSLLSENSVDETKKFNLFKKIYSILGIGEKKYFGNFEIAENGYIPWTRGTGSLTSNIAINYSDYYKDNLSGLKKSDVKIFNFNESVYGFTGSDITNSLISNDDTGTSNAVCEYDGLTCSGSGGLSGKKVGIKVFDKAGNINYCESAITKVDNSFPLVKINGIKDYKNQENVGDYLTSAGMILTNKGYTFDIELNDQITILNSDGTYDFSNQGDNILNGNSGFNPDQFSLGDLMFCGKGADSNECIDDILNENELGGYSTHKEYLSKKYFYRGYENSTSEGLFFEGEGDLIPENGVLFEKDAYFSNTGVIIKNGLEILTLEENGDFLNGSGEIITYNESNFDISISDGTGSFINQVLFVESGSNSGAYLSTAIGLYKIDNLTWTPNGIKVLSQNKMLGESEKPVKKGKVAFKIYAKQGLEGPQPGDYFYINFDFMDRAGNGLPLKYGFTLKESVFAKILGNIQSGQKSSTFDENVQTFEMKESIVKNNVEKIKINLSDILTNAKDLNGSGIFVESITDLNEYKISLGDEDIYLIKNGDIILGDSTGTGTLNLNTGKAITIATYGGNILFNSRYINASENTAFVSLINPYLSTLDHTNPLYLPLEAQGNILINPELLIGKGQLIAEGSIMSYANLDGKIETIFDMDSRRSIFKNQLVWDGTMISNNTVGGYHQGTCPVSIYGFGNTCGLNKETQFDELKAISLTYDLHYLRSYIFDGSNSNALISETPLVTGNLTSKMSGVFNTKTNLTSGIHEITPGMNITSIDVIKNIDSSSAPETLKTMINSISSLFQYPIIIKHSTPTKDMKIFK